MFNKVKCQNCGFEYDEYADFCPACQSENNLSTKKNKVPRMQFINSLKQILIFLMGWGIIKVVATMIQLIIKEVGKTIYTSDSALSEFMSSDKVNIIINAGAYLIIFVGILAILWNDVLPFVRSFKKIRPLIYGIGYGFLVLVITTIYSYLIKVTGISFGDNQNEATVSNIMVSYPFLAFVIFVVIGPLVEEFTYRVGLFSFLYRINKYLAYAVAGAVFGLIHMSFNFSDTNAFLNELLNLPSYIFAGLAFCYAYQKEGYACSAYAHVINNLVAFISTQIQYYAGK